LSTVVHAAPLNGTIKYTLFMDNPRFLFSKKWTGVVINQGLPFFRLVGILFLSIMAMYGAPYIDRFPYPAENDMTEKGNVIVCYMVFTQFLHSLHNEYSFQLRGFLHKCCIWFRRLRQVNQICDGNFFADDVSVTLKYPKLTLSPTDVK
jgi:hypothetical protein